MRPAPTPPPVEEPSRSSKITSLPTRRGARKTDSGGFPQMPEPPVFNEPTTSSQPVMAAHTEPAQLAPALVDEALRRGSADNITALVVKYVP